MQSGPSRRELHAHDHAQPLDRTINTLTLFHTLLALEFMAQESVFALLRGAVPPVTAVNTKCLPDGLTVVRNFACRNAVVVVVIAVHIERHFTLVNHRGPALTTMIRHALWRPTARRYRFGGENSTIRAATGFGAARLDWCSPIALLRATGSLTTLGNTASATAAEELGGGVFGDAEDGGNEGQGDDRDARHLNSPESG